MSESLRALVVVVILALAVFWLARLALPHDVVTASDYRRRCMVWLAITVVAFTMPDFWFYVGVSALLMLWFSQHEPNPLALYALLLFAVPPFSRQLPGLGLANYFYDVSHINLLNLVLLAPFALRLSWARLPVPPTVRLLDGVLLAYMAAQIWPYVTDGNATTLLRAAFLLPLELWLPYYTVTRSIRNLAALRELLLFLVLGITLMAVIGDFEAVRNWLLYRPLENSLHVEWGFGQYHFRGDGLLRAQASTGHSIVLGACIVAALGLAVAAMRHVANPTLRRALWLALATGLLATVSRGPWVGAVAALAVGLGLGAGGLGRLLKLGAAVIGVAVLLALAGKADMVIAYLPFVGTVDAGSVTYRQMLFDTSWHLLMQSPWFGVPDYMSTEAMESLRTGEGIIDMVNSYMTVALGAGFVGLAFFLAPFCAGLGLVWRGRGRSATLDPELEATGRALLAALVGMMVTLATVSMVSVIPVLCWLLLGSCAAYAAIVEEARATAPEALHGDQEGGWALAQGRI